MGSTLVFAVAVGEAEGVGAAVVVGDELGVLEAEAVGLMSPPQAVSSMVAASGMARRATEGFFTCVADFVVLNCTVSPTVMRTGRA